MTTEDWTKWMGTRWLCCSWTVSENGAPPMPVDVAKFPKSSTCGLGRLGEEGLSGSLQTLPVEIDLGLPLDSKMERDATCIRSVGCHVLPLNKGVPGLLSPSSLGDAEGSLVVDPGGETALASAFDRLRLRKRSTASSSEPWWSFVTRSSNSANLSWRFWLRSLRLAMRRRSSVSNLHSVPFLTHWEQLGSLPSHFANV